MAKGEIGIVTTGKAQAGQITEKLEEKVEEAMSSRGHQEGDCRKKYNNNHVYCK